MPSQNYNPATISNRERAVRDLSAAERLRRADTRYAFGESLAKRQYGSTPKHLALSDKEKFQQRKQLGRQLSHLQKKAPKLAAGLAAGKKKAISQLAGNLFKKIDISVDWLFILLASFGLLKDIFDIAFAALGAVPVLGTAGAAVGIIISFVGDMFFLILVVTILVLVGGSIKNRGMAKYLIGIAMEFIAEALPGISWLPWTVVYVFILYLCVLYDRAYRAGAQTEQTADSEAADKYTDRQRQSA
ncbi:MAG TPA: hypothetical protein VK254_04340 [Candidatus Bathyarchaeia archaeon]|nr:hypothetical protein [Candidatus Bathyarchaeia archaeon]